jgi:hypothetical protein
MTQLLIWAGVVVMAAYAFATVYGSWRRSGKAREGVAQMQSGRVTPVTTHCHASESAALSASVQRYFQAALTDGQQIIATAEVTQKGNFNLSTAADQWKPLTAKQVAQTNWPGFICTAKVMLFPGLPVRVVDAYVAGTGTLRPSIPGLYPLADMYGTGEIARGKLLRHFAESVWFPTALLPSQGVVWQAVDDTSATATLTDGPINVMILFWFKAVGLISAIQVDGRATTVSTETVLMPWECRMSNYQTRDDMRVPLRVSRFISPYRAKSLNPRERLRRMSFNLRFEHTLRRYFRSAADPIAALYRVGRSAENLPVVT